MNNDALVAALGMDAVAAVHGYRLQVIARAQRCDLPLVSEPLSDVVRLTPDVCIVIDPIDIRLVFLNNAGHADAAARTLTWDPSHGWALSGPAGHSTLSYYAGPHACPLHLVPTPGDLLAWVTDELHGRSTGHHTPPKNLEIDDDPAAVQRLLGFIDPHHRMPVHQAFMPQARGSQHR